MVLELAFAASGHASDEDARLLPAALDSTQCSTRLAAISRYSRSEDDEHDNAALKRLNRNFGSLTSPYARHIIVAA